MKSLPLLFILAGTVLAGEPAGFEDALKLYDKQQYQECLKVVRTSADRQHHRVRMLEGNCEYVLGNIQRALGIYESICAATDEQLEPFLGQAKCYYTLNSFDKSLHYYELVLNRDPTSVVAARGKGACMIYLGKDQEALKAYDRTKASPFSADEVDLWLHLLVKAEKLDEAVRYCERNIVQETDLAIRPNHDIFPSDKEHGKMQYAQMIKDRPQLLMDANLTKIMEKWCIEAFAGRVSGRRIYWSADGTLIPREVCSAVFLDSQDRLQLMTQDAQTIRSILIPAIAKPSDHDVAEFLWSAVVFEHFNAEHFSEFEEAISFARKGKITKKEFCLRFAEGEHKTFKLVRDFYVQNVWKRMNGKQTDPRLWHIAHPTDFDVWLGQHKDSENPWRIYRGIFDNLKR